MTSPDGDIVARLKVGLDPDPTGFRQKTNAIVESTEESIDEIDVRVQPELVGFAEVMAQLAAMQAMRIDIPAEVELTGMDDVLTEALIARSALEAIGAIPIRVDAGDVDQIFRRLGAEFEVLATRTGENLQPAFRKSIMDAWNMSAQNLDFSEFARRAAQQIENDMKGRPPSVPSLNFDNLFKDLPDDIFIRIDARPQLDVLAMAAVVKRIGVLTRRTVAPIVPVVNSAAARLAATQLARLSGARVATNEIRKMYEAFQNLDRALPVIASLTTGIIGLIGWLGTAVSNVFALGVSLAQIGPLALALPALFVGAAIGVGIMVAAFKDFNSIFPQVQGELAALQDRISSNFWASATEGVRAFLDAPWQAFQEGVAATSTGLGSLVGQFAGDLATTLNLAPMFADLNSGIEILKGATGPIASIIQLLGEAGSTVIPILSEKFVGLAETFAAFLENKGVDGLSAMFETAVFQAGELFRALGGLGNILVGIGTAATAAGGSSLTMLADTLDRVAAVVNGPAFQDTLITFFTAAHQAMTNIATIAGPAVEVMFQTLAGTLSSILPLVGTTIGTLVEAIATGLSNPAFNEGFTAFIEGIAAGFQALAPAIPPIAAAFGELGAFVGAMAANLGPVLGTLFTVLAESLTGILPAIQPLIPVLGGALIQVVTALAPVIAQLAAAFASLITGGVVPALTTAISALLPVIMTLAPIIADVLVTALSALTPILPLIGTLFALIASTLAELLVPILVALSPILELLIGVIVAVVAALMPFAQAILELLTAVLTPLLPVIMTLIEAALIPLMSVINLIAPVVQILGDILLWLVQNVIVPILVPIITFLADLFNAVLRPAIDAIGTVFKATFDFIQGIFNAFKALFSGDVKGFIEGIKNAFTEFGSRLGSIVSDAWNKLWELIKSAWNNISGAVTDGIGTVVGHMIALPGKITGALGNLGSLLLNAGKDVVQGLINGLTNMLGSLRQKAQEIANTVKNAVTGLLGIDSPSKVFAELGQFTMEGFIDGLESRFKDVRRSLGGLGQDMTKVRFNLPVSASLTGIDAALADAHGGGGTRILNYYAAPGSGLSSEEELFAAAGRGRAWGF